MDWNSTRHDVFRRDNYACISCGSQGKIYADYVTALPYGGADTLENLETLCGVCLARKQGIDAATFWLFDAGLRQLGISLGRRDEQTGIWIYDQQVAKAMQGLHFRFGNVAFNIRGIEASVLVPLARLSDEGEIITELPEGFYESLLPMFETHCIEQMNAGQMTPEYVEHILRENEGQRTEFKKSFAEQNEAVKTLCAFAHAEGGTVFFGVRNDGSIIGVTLGRNTLEGFANIVRHNTSPPLSPSVDQISLDKQLVVTATVPKMPYNQVFHAFGRAYIRIGKANHVMSPEELRIRLQRGIVSWPEAKNPFS